MDPVLPSLLPIAIALLLSLALGRMASRAGLPRVTVYLLVGLALGPHALLGLVGEGSPASILLLGDGTDAPLRAASELAIGFILFGVGSQFRFPTFRRVGPRVLALSGMEIGATAILVACAVFAVTADWRLAAIAPALAVSSAPSATLVTLREVEAEGPTSRCLILCVGHNNLVALLAFPLLVALAYGGVDAGTATLFALGAILGGGALGIAGAVWLESITGRRELVLLGILVVVATLGAVHWFDPGSVGLGMLGCFAAGMAIANASPHSEPFFRYLENTVYPLYVLFFIAAGRDLHIGALGHVGWLGVLLVAARAIGKLAGARLGLHVAHLEEGLPNFLGAGLLCQAGVALGLVAALESSAPEATADLRQVVVASVVVFELIGPWLVRRTAVRAGEVKLANLVPVAEATGFQALRWVWLETRRNLGLLRADVLAPDGAPRVRHVMQRRPQTVSEALSFDLVLKALGETGSELLPVLDPAGRFSGIISYDEVKNTLYDPMLRGLVIAGDLTTSVPDALGPDETLPHALEILDRHRVHAWPVVEDDRLIGMVRRSDLYGLMRRVRPRQEA
jgi:Kef-type K+ transport system membrane component KefB/CBS domain-containing protein